MQTFSIRELTREFGVTARTIRHYEELGLLAPERRGQTRVYSQADRVRLMLILRGRRLGFSLEESRDIIDMYDPAHGNRSQLLKLIARIEQQRGQLRERLTDLNAMLSELDAVEAGCRAALAGTGSTTRKAAARRAGGRT